MFLTINQQNHLSPASTCHLFSAFTAGMRQPRNEAPQNWFLCLKLWMQGMAGWVRDGSPHLLSAPACCFPCWQSCSLLAEGVAQEIFIHQNVPPTCLSMIQLQKAFASLTTAKAWNTYVHKKRWRWSIPSLSIYKVWWNLVYRGHNTAFIVGFNTFFFFHGNLKSFIHAFFLFFSHPSFLKR